MTTETITRRDIYDTLKEIKRSEMCPGTDAGDFVLLENLARPDSDGWYLLTPKGTKMLQALELEEERSTRFQCGHERGVEPCENCCTPDHIKAGAW